MKTIKSDRYDTYYSLNAGSLLMYKSSRKNSKCSDFISVNHLINHNEDRKIDDEKILSQFIGTIESIVYQSKKYNKHLEIKIFCHVFKQCNYINANNDLYCTVDDINRDKERQVYNSIEQVINAVFDLYAAIYPYNKIQRASVFNNPSIKYFINEYYNKGV